jgi:hypothetical protein
MALAMYLQRIHPNMTYLSPLGDVVSVGRRRALQDLMTRPSSVNNSASEFVSYISLFVVRVKLGLRFSFFCTKGE